MTQELRARDSYSGLGGRGGQGEPPGRSDSHFPDEGLGSGAGSGTGEAAWDLAEPSFDLTPDPGPSANEAERRDEPRDEAPMPFPGFPGMGGEEEEPAKGPGLDVKRLARGIVKRFWLAAGIAFTIAGLFLVMAVTLIKPKWEAAAAVMVHTRQDKFSLGGSKPFELQDYSAQLESARKELRAVTAEMRAFKANKKVSDFGAETQVLLGSLVGQESELNTKIAETQALREALAHIEKAVQGEPEMVVTSSVYRNPLKIRLSDYEWQLQEARSRYTEQNPKVIKLQSRVDEAKVMMLRNEAAFELYEAARPPTEAAPSAKKLIAPRKRRHGAAGSAAPLPSLR